MTDLARAHLRPEVSDAPSGTYPVATKRPSFPPCADASEEMLIVYTSQNARSGGQELALTLEQHELLRALGVWPVDREGRAYASAWLVPCEPGRKPTMGTKDLLRYLASAEGGAR